MHPDVEEVRLLLASPDPRVRMLAARSACPCRGTFDLLIALKPELQLLAATDPDAKVRGAARHVLRDPIAVNFAEEAELARERRAEKRQERREHRRAVRSDVAMRRARRLPGDPA
jgi:HEAT repeat protein